MGQIEVRALEFHNARLWSWASVQRALEFMSRFGMNALIFHQNDLLDQLVYPQAYFPEDLMLSRWPIRLSTVRANRQYIRKVVREANRRGIDFYIEIKELWYPEGIVEQVPELLSAGGAVCRTHPFWWTFLQNKIDELLEAVPDIAGIIESPATHESKLSIAANPCRCERCRDTEPSEWYERLIRAMHAPLAKKGKKLVVRDFTFNSQNHDLILGAASRCSKDIVIALKNTPQDYWPTFPDNPKIGRVDGHPQWIEFDAFGQFYAFGAFPCSVVEDMQKRMRYSLDRGASGTMMRISWEVIDEATCFNSFNVLNLIAGAMLSQDAETDLDDIYRAWADYGLAGPLLSESCIREPVIPASPQAVAKLKAFMTGSWSVMEKTHYIRRFVFAKSGLFPASLHEAFHIMTSYFGLGKWDPSAAGLVEPTDENIARILREKEQAMEEVDRLPAVLDARGLGVPEEMVERIEEMLELYRYYVHAAFHCARTCFLAKKVSIARTKADEAALRSALAELGQFRSALRERLAGTDYPHYYYWLLDEHRLGLLQRDVSTLLPEPDRDGGIVA